MIILVLAILMVLFFTFQDPEKSRALSERVRGRLGRIGIDVEYMTLRHNIHYFGILHRRISSSVLLREYEVEDLDRSCYRLRNWSC